MKQSSRSRARRDDPLWRVACHEAGHAVIAAVLGILAPDTTITIVPDGSVAGSVEFSPDTGEDAWKRWGVRYTRKAIVATYAGPAVSLKLDPGLDLFDENGWHDLDMVHADMFCEWIGDPALYEGDKKEIFETRNSKKAVSLVELNWLCIASVADELLKRRTMRGHEVKGMLK